MSSVSDYSLANQGFSAFRTELNNILAAINTLNAGSSAPSSQVAGSLWLDTTSASTPTLKFYDGSDQISLCTFNYSANTVNWLDSTVSADLSGDSSPQLGGDLDVVTYDIVSTSNRDIDIAPHGTGDVVLKADTVTVGDAAAAAETIDMYIDDGGTGTDYEILSDQAIGANETFEFTTKFVISDEDHLCLATASSAAVDVVVSYLDQTR